MSFIGIKVEGSSTDANDPYAIHTNKSNEINTLTELTVLTGNEFLVVENPLTEMGKNKVKIGTSRNDPNALHVNVNNEIFQITEKYPLSSNDRVVIEDSQDNNDKKSAAINAFTMDVIGDGTTFKKMTIEEQEFVDSITSTPANIDDAVTKRHIQGTDITLGIQSRNIDMGGFRAINSVDPIDQNDLANKDYVDHKYNLLNGRLFVEGIFNQYYDIPTNWDWTKIQTILTQSANGNMASCFTVTPTGTKILVNNNGVKTDLVVYSQDDSSSTDVILNGPLHEGIVKSNDNGLYILGLGKKEFVSDGFIFYGTQSNINMWQPSIIDSGQQICIADICQAKEHPGINFLISGAEYYPNFLASIWASEYTGGVTPPIYTKVYEDSISGAILTAIEQIDKNSFLAVKCYMGTNTPPKLMYTSDMSWIDIYEFSELTFQEYQTSKIVSCGNGNILIFISNGLFSPFSIGFDKNTYIYKSEDWGSTFNLINTDEKFSITDAFYVGFNTVVMSGIQYDQTGLNQISGSKISFDLCNTFKPLDSITQGPGLHAFPSISCGFDPSNKTIYKLYQEYAGDQMYSFYRQKI